MINLKCIIITIITVITMTDTIIKGCIETCKPYMERRMPIFFQYREFNDTLSYQVYTMKNKLYISIKNSIIPSNMALKYSGIPQECIVCYNNCYTKIGCCDQPLCKQCLNQLQHLSCPMCRAEIEYLETEYIIPIKAMKLLGF
jgi:hypothetical protein